LKREERVQQVEQLATEIRLQLTEDILYFGWIVQIARLQNPGGVEADWVSAVDDAIVLLAAGDEIVIGNAKNLDGRVQIESWPEKGQALRERLERSRESAVGLDRDFCFWVGTG
jgi:hypothetical protein